MSVAFTREESAETAAEVELPNRPIPPHPNLVTASGLEASLSGHEIFRRSPQDSSARSWLKPAV
jgi:hypothetical protein